MDFSIKTTLVVLLSIASFKAKASARFYSPGFCDPKDLTLIVTNNTAETQRLWTQVSLNDEIEEHHFDLQGHQQIKISGEEFLPEKKGFALKTWDAKALQVKSICKGVGQVTLTSTTSPTVTHWFPQEVTSIKAHVLNLFLNSNKVLLKAFSSTGKLVEEKSISLESSFATESLKWIFSEPILRIEITAENRINSVAFFDKNNEEWAGPSWVPTPTRLPLNTEKTYFLVSTKESLPDESFVIALDDPHWIEVARKQIQNPNLEKIIVGGISLGHGGFNRSFSTKDRSPFSWSVSRIDAFADFAHIDCDGSPDLVEERLLQRINQGGRICFWRYRVTKELTPLEVSQGRLKP